MHRLLIGLLACFAVSTAHAIDRYVATTGSDVANNCSVSATPCLTLQHAINQASANDTINVASGTYSLAGLITVDKTLTFLGAQANVDARTRVATESILSNTQGIRVAASNVVFNGFTMTGSTNAAFTGFGMWLDPIASVDGTQIIYNIFTDNIAGLSVANAGTTQARVQFNRFTDNNQPGPATGTGIYADQFASGAVSNVLIDSNAFDDNDTTGIGISNTAATLYSNFVITNNTFDGNGNAIYAFRTTNTLVQNNVVTNGAGSAIALLGGTSAWSILNNDLTGGPRGVHVVDTLTENGNTSIEVHFNNITASTIAGLENEDDVPVNATCNWWGAASGPTNAGNPGGTGTAVIGLATFIPFLIAPAPGGPCGLQAPSVPVPTLAPLALMFLILGLGAAGVRRIARTSRK